MRFSFFLIFFAHAALAQVTYQIDQRIPVSFIKGEPLSMPWAGGLNASQFNTMDLNGDGDDDLVIFDRMTSHIIPFLQVNNQYEYAPQYQQFFPEGVELWMLLRDFNGDGRNDIFTGDNLGMKVYENVTTEEGLLEWKHVIFYGGLPGLKSDVVLTTALSAKVNLQLNYDDLPSISDVDGDGDLDLLNPSFHNSSQIEYHKNLTVEKYGTLDSLDFERITETWGGVENCHCGEFSFNNEPCHEGGKVAHAGGKSLLALDADHDGIQDLVFSESECGELDLLVNSGTTEDPLVTNTSLFPASNPAFMVIYPAAYYEDVDFDNKKDLLVTPNIFSREFLQTNLRQSTLFYKNTGTTSQPVFTTTPQLDFLQKNMIDVGDNAAPVFFDVDGDGDLDMLVGNYIDNLRGSVYFYENIGTPSAPEFELITQDYLNLSLANIINIRPMFADMNGDTKCDFVFTATSRFNGATQLYYFLNDRYIGAAFTSSLISTNFFVFQNEPITVADVDLDQKMDLLIGRSNGSLEFWKNVGSKKTPSWSLEDNSFLGLGSDLFRQYPVASVADLDGDRKADLLLGDQAGTVSIINNFREAESPTILTEFVYNPILEAPTAHWVGGRAWPVAANLYKTNKPLVIVGNALGGLTVFNPSESVAEPTSPIIQVYPNPVAEESQVLNIKTDLPAIMYVASSLGQEVIPTRYFQAAQEYQVQLPELNKGVYLLRFIINGKSYTRKILIY